jgi:hypothetical protein
LLKRFKGAAVTYIPIASTLAQTAVERANRNEPPARVPRRRLRFAAARSLRRAAARLEPGSSRA